MIAPTGAGNSVHTLRITEVDGSIVEEALSPDNAKELNMMLYGLINAPISKGPYQVCPASGLDQANRDHTFSVAGHVVLGTYGPNIRPTSTTSSMVAAKVEIIIRMLADQLTSELGSDN